MMMMRFHLTFCTSGVRLQYCNIALLHCPGAADAGLSRSAREGDEGGEEEEQKDVGEGSHLHNITATGEKMMKVEDKVANLRSFVEELKREERQVEENQQQFQKAITLSVDRVSFA